MTEYLDLVRKGPDKHPVYHIGDLVVLNSGGPIMVVVDILSDHKVITAYKFETNLVTEHEFPTKCLTPHYIGLSGNM